MPPRFTGENMSTAESRIQIAQQQTALVRALSGLGPPPQEFDADDLSIAATALAQKRLREVARAWPNLAASLGDLFATQFRLFAATTPIPHEGGPLADGFAFAQHLHSSGQLPDAGHDELIATALRFRPTSHGLTARRGPFIQIRLSRRPFCFVFAARVPLVGELWFRFPRGK